MINTIETNKLKEHHKNGYYFTDIEGEKYEEVKRSIETHGIRDPIKCTRDYTVISGHQRLRIARDLGLEKVPYQMLDVDEKTAEYLLIAENVERRGQAETDPIKKSRIANFLKGYWGVQRGNNQHSIRQNGGSIKTVDDVREVFGDSKRSMERILKLHDLIPQLQTLVSEGKLGTTAGEQLAYLSTEVQTALYETLGDEIAKKTVKETKELRREVQDKTPKEVVEVIKQENERLRVELKRKSEELAKAKTPKVVEKEVIKEVVPESVKQRLREIEKERDELDAALSQTYARLRDLERLEKSVKHQTQSPLYDMYRSLMSVEGYLQVFAEDERLSGDLVANADKDVVDKVNLALSRVLNLTRRAKDIVDGEQIDIIDIN